jgi:hypothetical protein
MSYPVISVAKQVIGSRMGKLKESLFKRFRRERRVNLDALERQTFHAIGNGPRNGLSEVYTNDDQLRFHYIETVRNLCRQSMVQRHPKKTTLLVGGGVFGSFVIASVVTLIPQVAAIPTILGLFPFLASIGVTAIPFAFAGILAAAVLAIALVSLLVIHLSDRVKFMDEPTPQEALAALGTELNQESQRAQRQFSNLFDELRGNAMDEPVSITENERTWPSHVFGSSSAYLSREGNTYAWGMSS